MLALAVALTLHFTGMTAQRLPLEFTLRHRTVAGLAVVARADCGRFGYVTEVQRFAPVRVHDSRFRAVNRDVPAEIAPQGDIAILTGRLSFRRAAGTISFRARRSDTQVGWIICTTVGVRWSARAR